MSTQESSIEWYERQGEEDRRQKEREHHARVTPPASDRRPMHVRPTAWHAEGRDRIRLESSFRPPRGAYTKAEISARRHINGIEVFGGGSAEQLRELLAALTAETTRAIQDHESEGER